MPLRVRAVRPGAAHHPAVDWEAEDDERFHPSFFGGESGLIVTIEINPSPQVVAFQFGSPSRLHLIPFVLTDKREFSKCPSSAGVRPPLLIECGAA